VEKGGDHDEEGVRQLSELGNVVRIPRDWFGPKEDLVPLGPAAAQPSLVEAETRAEARKPSLGSLTGRESEPAATDGRAPLDPNTFWGEDSSLIQDVVAAPAEASGEPDPGAPVTGGGGGIALSGLPAVGRALVGAARTKALAVSACVFLILIASVVVWQIGGSPSPTFRASVASLARQRSNALFGSWGPHQIKSPVGRLANTSQRSTIPRRSRIHPVNRLTRNTTRHSEPKAPASAYSPTEVTYHSSQSTSSSPPIGYQQSPTPASAPAESASSRRTSTATVASAPPTHSSTGAFGTSGALGPMSSPAG
jgi:hypothetical protein